MRLAAGPDALSSVPPEACDSLFGDEWPLMWGMRNRIAHTYARVETTVIVATVDQALPRIRAAIEGHLAS